MAGSGAWLGGSKACLAGSWAEGGNGRTYGRTLGKSPILHNFVPYRGRCPAAAQLQPKNCIKRGKGTADHMMPLGDWFSCFLGSGRFFNGSFFGQRPR